MAIIRITGSLKNTIQGFSKVSTFDEHGRAGLLSYAGVLWSIFLVGTLYLIGVWLGADQRTNIIKAHVLERIGWSFQIWLTTPRSLANTVGRTYEFCFEGINKHALPITMTRGGTIFRMSFVDVSLLDLSVHKNLIKLLQLRSFMPVLQIVYATPISVKTM